MARNPSRPDHSFSAAKPKEEAPADARGLPPTSPADGGKPPDHVIGWPQKLIWRSGGSKKAEARRAPTHRAPGTAACSLQGRSIAAALSLKAAQSDWFRTPLRGAFLLEVEWPRNGSTEGARDAEMNTSPQEKLRAIAVRAVNGQRHTVGSVFRAVPGDQEGVSLHHAKKLPKGGP